MHVFSNVEDKYNTSIDKYPKLPKIIHCIETKSTWRLPRLTIALPWEQAASVVLQRHTITLDLFFV
jgi:hypothetical protein